MNWLTNYINVWWSKYIYSPPEKIYIASVGNDSYTTPARTTYKHVPNQIQVPVYYSRVVNIGYGRSYTVYETRYESRTTYETKIEYAPASTSYFIQLRYTEISNFDVKTMNLVCMSIRRQTELVEYFESNKTINVRHLLGGPIISDIGYNWWFECPQALTCVIIVPTIVLISIMKWLI